MFANLEKVRKDKGVSLVDIADLLGLRYQTVSDKINGASDFKFGEAIKIKNKFFPEYEIVYLFSRDDSEDS
ncbi:helix-turn-helix domain-containing protein [Staphylococcus hyicus]|uniref:helix-turn-helix domain-containing protein n=1 Tax=Staphylococcus hyicus TaxID=1284 RepID=UPI0023665526|nr:helix-turn-helix transcriptional regulator [Staphylococcus hyicus]